LPIITFIISDTSDGAVDIKVHSDSRLPLDIIDYTPAQQCAVALRQAIEEEMKEELNEANASSDSGNTGTSELPVSSES